MRRAAVGRPAPGAGPVGRRPGRRGRGRRVGRGGGQAVRRRPAVAGPRPEPGRAPHLARGRRPPDGGHQLVDAVADHLELRSLEDGVVQSGDLRDEHAALHQIAPPQIGLTEGHGRALSGAHHGHVARIRTRVVVLDRQVDGGGAG